MNIHFLKHLFFVLMLVAGFSLVVMFLWNLLFPDIFGLATINFWQSLGLLLLVRVLAGNLNDYFWIRHERMYSNRSTVYEKWKSMTPEERREFVKNRHHHHYGYDADSERSSVQKSKSGKES